MKIVINLSLFLVGLLIIGCDSKEKEIDNLKAETIQVHDEVMPKMDVIMNLKSSLKRKQDSIDTRESEKIQELINSLESSDKAMMNWMRNYDPRMEDMSDEEKIEYLTQQKASIHEVSDEMKNSISEAEAYLNQ
ncbi:hypothetical protein [Marivirga sp.]|uniref:hypothetical protein n=1 Tax=Marivirga sp. TaxID=2018662 RepID=UPI002D7F0248|nr:hypothetical protein [Marivirga sp.]HET8861439.1 hypothetical protein [Marivirga sp.]